VLAAGKQGGEYTQIRIREQPAFRLTSDGPGSAYHRAEMFAAGNGAKMFGADSREAGNFIFGEDFLSGFNSDHSLPSFAFTVILQLGQKWNSWHNATYLLSNNPAVYSIPRFRASLNLQT
jgi:hypothetical protein